MLIVKVPKEIKEYREKILLGMSWRQLLFTGLALLSGGGAFLVCLFLFGMNPSDATYFVAIAAIPFLAMGFIQKNGMPFERYFMLMLRHTIGNRQRPYMTEYENPKMNGGRKIENIKVPKQKNRQGYKGEVQSVGGAGKSAKKRISETRKRIKAARKEAG